MKIVAKIIKPNLTIYAFFFRENDRLKDQLRQYMSAVEIGKALKNDSGENAEVDQYERKLVQVNHLTHAVSNIKLTKTVLIATNKRCCL